jgi:hypothetical protein
MYDDGWDLPQERRSINWPNNLVVILSEVEEYSDYYIFHYIQDDQV